jgi:asparagine synthase (glutamine-hydrolysing)
VYRSDGRHATGETAFRDLIGEAVRDSVRAHLVSDVPVGIFLSGGIDSSAIVSAATSTGAARLQTFTVGFDDATSEAVHARTIAKAFGTEHHELRVDAPHVVGDLSQIFACLDQPTIDAVNSFYVSRAVASTGIKTVLSGTGGDELFGGYSSFSRLPRAMAIRRATGSAWPLVARAAGSIVPARLRARWRHFAATDGDLADAYRVQRGFLQPDEVADLAGEALCEPSIWTDAAEEIECVERLLVAPAGEETDVAGVARLETRVYLASQLLRDIDVMAMAHGLEVRVPFVDHELASAVWPELGFHRSLLARKRMLFDSLQRPLPDAIVRRPKQGFTLPFAEWIGGELAPVVRDGMQQLADGGWIVADAPARVWSDWQSGAVHWTRPWGLAVLGHFLSRAA